LKKPVSLEEMASILSCRYIGDKDHLISGINEIHQVERGDLTFVDVEKYYKKALGSKATTILINKEVEPPEGKGLIISDEPFNDYNRLTSYFQPQLPLDISGDPSLGKEVKVGRNVVFGENTEIGDFTEIGHNVVIGSHVKIGAHCKIHANVSIYDHSILEDYVVINSGVVLGGEAFYFKSRPDRKDKLLSKGRVWIKEHVDIGANCTIDRGVSGDTVIGAYTKLDNLIQIGHDTVIGERCIIASQVGIAGVCHIEDEVVLWGQVGIPKEIVIGKKAVLLGKSGAMNSLEGGKTYFGMIAGPVKQTFREIASIRKLPDLLRKWEKADKKSE
ncbi:MAG: UDP-3-O-(3-hydroxymyristoyl)glucosamine N-acyltransferase, partial [Bacteroidota bacterium]